MDDNLQDLYQEIILDHNKHPRNQRLMEDATAMAMGHNPLCGDDISVFIKVNEAGIIEDVSFKGQGCAISQASASLMTQRVKGKSLKAVQEAIDQVCAMLTSEQEPDISLETLGDLAALCGVRQFHARIKCATLAWHALEAALAGKKEITTE